MLLWLCIYRYGDRHNADVANSIATQLTEQYGTDYSLDAIHRKYNIDLQLPSC